MHHFPLFIVLLGIYAIRVMGGGEDWYDVWNEGEPYGWLTDIKELLRGLGFIMVGGLGLCFIWAITPSTTNSFTSSYAESTPIKVASATPKKLHKKHPKKKRATAKSPLSGQKRVSQ